MILKPFSFIFIILSFILLFLDAHTKDSFSQNEKLFYQSTENPFGHNFTYWATNYWNYLFSNDNLQDPDRVRESYHLIGCSSNQNDGPVWFLPDGLHRPNIDTPEVRECNIPSGKSVMIQIVGSHCTINDGIETPQQFKECADWKLDQAKIKIGIDNLFLTADEIKSIYLNSTWTKFYIPENNTSVTDRGELIGMVAGYFLITPPLPDGQHVIEIEDTVGTYPNIDPKNVDIHFSSTKYCLTVGNNTSNGATQC
ncbi:hypothetical protein [Candidatus Nitrosocosmicus sp. T]